jgi:hypothetical protein
LVVSPAVRVLLGIPKNLLRIVGPDHQGIKVSSKKAKNEKTGKTFN